MGRQLFAATTPRYIAIVNPYMAVVFEYRIRHFLLPTECSSFRRLWLFFPKLVL